MPKLPIVSGRKLVKAFGKMGFVFVSQKGDHLKMKHSDGRVVIIPDHKTIKKGTLKKGILNPLHISVEELIELLD